MGADPLVALVNTASLVTKWLVSVRLLACLHSSFFQRGTVPPRPDRCAKPECGGAIRRQVPVPASTAPDVMGGSVAARAMGA